MRSRRPAQLAPPRAHVLNDTRRRSEPVVFLRGNPDNRGPTVPRQAPAVIAPNRKPFTEGSGRLELAKAIASPDNPLTARVLVNRVWAGHFGARARAHAERLRHPLATRRRTPSCSTGSRSGSCSDGWA